MGSGPCAFGSGHWAELILGGVYFVKYPKPEQSPFSKQA